MYIRLQQPLLRVLLIENSKKQPLVRVLLIDFRIKTHKSTRYNAFLSRELTVESTRHLGRLAHHK